MIRKIEYYPLFMKLRRNELGINSIPIVIEKLTNKNLINLYKIELNNIDNLIIFIEFLKEFISVFSHKYKYENLIEEMFDMYSNMLDEYYSTEKKDVENKIEDLNIYDINNAIEEKFVEESFENYYSQININLSNNFGNKNYFEKNVSLLAEESCFAAEENDKQASMEKAKESYKKERLLAKQREERLIGCIRFGNFQGFFF